MRFIKLTSNGLPIYVNPDQIEFVIQASEGGCYIRCASMSQRVQEAPELVAQLASDLTVRSAEDLR